MFPQNHNIVKVAAGPSLWCSEPSKEAVVERLRVPSKPSAGPPLREAWEPVLMGNSKHDKCTRGLGQKTADPARQKAKLTIC